MKKVYMFIRQVHITSVHIETEMKWLKGVPSERLQYAVRCYGSYV